MTQFIRPARRFSFVVEGVVPPTPLTDEETKFFLIAVRNLVLAQLVGAITAVPTPDQLAMITLTPVLGEVSGTIGGQQ